jgi:hypothetical protein
MKDVIILLEQTSAEEVSDLASDLPSDLHLVEYTQNGEFQVDGVRAFTKVDIFNFYYDYLKATGEPFEIKAIKSGYGRIKPRLFNTQKEAS